MKNDYGTLFVCEQGGSSIWWHINEHDKVSMVGEPEAAQDWIKGLKLYN